MVRMTCVSATFYAIRMKIQALNMYMLFLTGLCLSVGKLYAVGGYDGVSRQCLSTVEEYDPVSNQWCYVAEMGTRRSGAGTTHCILPTVHPHREQHHSSTLSIQEK